MSAVIRPDGGTETFRYDGEGKIAVHSGAMGQTTRYRHGAFDLLREVEDAGGQRIVCDYDGAARLTQLTRSGNQRWRLYYDAAGQLAGEDDWSGRRTVYHRDEQGRLAEKVRPDGSVWRYARDEYGRVTTITGGHQQLRYGYDRYDRMVSAEVHECSDTTRKDYMLTSRITLEWDERHRLVAEEQDGQRTEYRYDEAGRLTGTKTADGETQREYDASGVLTAYRSNSHRMDFGHTRSGQEKQRRYRPQDEEKWLGQTPLNHAVYTREQGYDACGRTAWQRSGAERLAGSHESVASWRPLGEHRYAWDKSGRLTGHEVWSKAGTEQETRYSYDSRDQITNVLRLNADGAAQEERYRYPLSEQIAESRINGILSQHQYSNECVTQMGDSHYEYDACGRVIRRTEQKRGFRPQEWRYRWDDFDRLREVRTPDGDVWQYSYDAFGRRTAKRHPRGVEESATRSVKCITGGWGWHCRRVKSAMRTAARRCGSSGATGGALSCWRRKRGQRTTTGVTFIPSSVARTARRKSCTARTGERCGRGSEACGGWRQRTTHRITAVKAVMRVLWASGGMRRAGCGIIYTATTMPGRDSI